MSTHYGYETDDDLTEALGKCVVLKRLADVMPDEDYVLHASYWWRVVRADWGTSVLYLELSLIHIWPRRPPRAHTRLAARSPGSGASSCLLYTSTCR